MNIYVIFWHLRPIRESAWVDNLAPWSDKHWLNRYFHPVYSQHEWTVVVIVTGHKAMYRIYSVLWCFLLLNYGRLSLINENESHLKPNICVQIAYGVYFCTSFLQLQTYSHSLIDNCNNDKSDIYHLNNYETLNVCLTIVWNWHSFPDKWLAERQIVSCLSTVHGKPNHTDSVAI